MSQQILTSIPVQEFAEMVADLLAARLAPTDTKGEDKYLTKSEAAQALRISQKSVDNLVKTGKLRAHRVGRRVLFRKADLDESLKAIRVK